MASRPMDVFALPDLQEEVELFGEEGVVVFQFQSEEGEGLDE